MPSKLNKVLLFNKYPGALFPMTSTPGISGDLFSISSFFFPGPQSKPFNCAPSLAVPLLLNSVPKFQVVPVEMMKVCSDVLKVLTSNQLTKEDIEDLPLSKEFKTQLCDIRTDNAGLEYSRIDVHRTLFSGAKIESVPEKEGSERLVLDVNFLFKHVCWGPNIVIDDSEIRPSYFLTLYLFYYLEKYNAYPEFERDCVATLRFSKEVNEENAESDWEVLGVKQFFVRTPEFELVDGVEDRRDAFSEFEMTLNKPILEANADYGRIEEKIKEVFLEEVTSEADLSLYTHRTDKLRAELETMKNKFLTSTSLWNKRVTDVFTKFSLKESWFKEPIFSEHTRRMDASIMGMTMLLDEAVETRRKELAEDKLNED